MKLTVGRGSIGLLALGLLLGCDRGKRDEAAQSKSAKTETASGEDANGAKADPAKADDANADGAKADDANADGAKTDAATADPAKADDAKAPGVTPLPGTVVTAQPKLEGVDAYATISAEAAKAIAADGYVFAARYIRHSDEETHYITREEAEHILDAGLALFLVQIGRGWKHTIPTAERGKQDGALAVQEARALGYPAQAVVFLDIESVLDEDAEPEDVVTFATAWHDAVQGSFVPGYYVGPGGKLSAEQLGSLPFEHFWKSGTKVPTPEGRGYQLTQHRYEERGKNVVHGVGIDYDVTQDDEQGGALPWLAPPAQPER